MKKLIKTLSLSLITALLLGGIMFLSCTKEEKDAKNIKIDYSQQTNNLGEKHNQLCDFLNKKFPFVDQPDLNPISTQDFIEWTMASKDFFSQLGYTENEINQTIDQIIDFFNQFGDNPTTGESILMEKLKNTNDVVLLSCNTPDFSPQLKSHLLSLTQLARDTNSLQSDIDNIIEQVESLPLSYEKAVILDVYYHSKQYWADFNLFNSKDSPRNPGGMSDSEWQIICDTIGGVLGLPFGGFGSILMAGFMSWAVAHDQAKDKKPIA